ncbi:endonuclease/exonuclease/phosphatase (EEP) superfamily protein YafD [Wenyingzhuangia heitensis]|uniref:Endonuclease/exonuclease/phosphatase (EEP) superfamily protein YafD n=1 Tax=Wenyingzhuangia heitensis TaxID=1487859 RepID=A0ABX0UC18_9FLAO|nr:endonuclease/exonuclease/phosphatase family protein [Wenyingzhuangia heitensis]NIJ45096.1 endonuclease/exonuclease/phosphatase (EEP) superfamily protein YafD [Wenyingzhuangia heitensis]
MKRLNILDKFLFFTNSLVAALLIISYIIPYINPINYPSIAILSLTYPSLLILNLVFIILWIVKLKKQFLLSVIVIAIGFSHTKALFSFAKKEIKNKNDITLISYNVRQFNRYKWIKDRNIKKDISNFINQQQADIVCMQEFSNTKNISIKLTKAIEKKNQSSGLVIYSNYPVVNSGSFDFKNTSNDIIYADLKIDKKIIRIYNIHLQSFSLDTQKEHYGSKNNEALFLRFKDVFKKQSEQILQLKKHIKACPYPTILAGDFNNTAFSWNYKQLMETHKDAFVEAGKGFGKSYDYFIPFRIDFILPSNNMAVNSFTSFSSKMSDHFPIMARINLNN